MTGGTTGRLCQPIPQLTPDCRDGALVPSLLGCPLEQYQHISGDLEVLWGATLMVSCPSLGCDVSRHHGLARPKCIWLGISQEN